MGLEQDFGLALADMKSYSSPKTLSYLTSVLRHSFGNKSDNDHNGSGQGTMSLSDRDDDGDSDGHCSNWTESSGNEGIDTTLTEDHIVGDGDMDTKNGSGHRKWDATPPPGSSEEGAKHLVSVAIGFEEATEKNVTLRASRLGATSAKEKHLYEISSSPPPSSIRRRRNPLGITSTTTPKRNDADALCSHHLFPICRKILAKTPPLYRPNTGMGDVPDLDIKSISEKVEPEKKTYYHGLVVGDNRTSPYQEIIGKISETRIQKDFARVPLSVLLSPPDLQNTSKNTRAREKRKKKTFGIGDFSKPITNPLYKVYNPEGYKKTDDELAGEFITKIESEFNEWLIKLEGEAVQLDPNQLARILRIEMQLPDTLN